MRAPTRPDLRTFERLLAVYLGLNLEHVIAGSIKTIDSLDTEHLRLRLDVRIAADTYAELQERAKPPAVREVERLEREAGLRICSRATGALTEADAQAILAFRDWLEQNPRRP